MYLLDTDWIIQTLLGREPAASVVRRLRGGRLCVSLVTAGELDEPAFTSPNPQAHLVSLRHFLAAHEMLTLNDAIMERFAETRSYLRRQGQLITDLDLLIAATALHHNLTLLTFNVRDFQRIPGLMLDQPR